MTLLQGVGIEQCYGRFALRVDEVAVDPGEVLGILGPSGAGKSSLLRILGLVEKPASGRVLVDGKPVSPRSKNARRRMSAALQQAALWRGTVLENVAFGLRVRGVPKAERLQRCLEALERLGISDLAERRSDRLSGGQAHRVGLARALAVKPDILFLDEPLAHVDEPLREELAVNLRRFVDEVGCATIWVTHDRAEAVAVSDRLAIVDAGRLLQTGEPEEVFSRPADERVARLVGAENIYHGKIVAPRRGVSQVAVEGARLEVAGDFPSGSEVVVLLRPEDVNVWSAPPPGPSPRNRFRGTVVKVISLGALVRLRIEGPLPTSALLTRPTLQDLRVSEGSEVWFGFKATAPHTLRRT